MAGLLGWFRQAVAAVRGGEAGQGRLLVLVTVPADRMTPERLCTVYRSSDSCTSLLASDLSVFL